MTTLDLGPFHRIAESLPGSVLFPLAILGLVLIWNTPVIFAGFSALLRFLWRQVRS